MLSSSSQLQHIEKLCDAGNAQALQAWSLQCAQTEISQSSMAFVYIENYISKQRNQLPATYDCIDALRPMHSAIIDKLHNLIHCNEPLSSPHNKVLSNTILALMKSEVAAYQTIFKQGLEQKVDNESQAIYLHRALATQLYALINRQKLKLPIPVHYWKNFHQYFSLANQRNMLGFRFCDGSLAWDHRLSIENLYCIALLLGAARLNKLSSKQINSVFEILGELIDSANLSVSPSKHENEIVVDISSNKGPIFNNLIKFNENAVLVYLKVDRLIRQLENKADQQSTFIAPLYRHLAKAWGECSKREERQKISQNILTSLQFEDVHFFLSGHQQLHELVGEKATLAIEYEENENIKSLEEQRSQNVFGAGLIEAKGELVFDEIPNWVHLKQGYSSEKTNQLHNLIASKVIDKSHSGCKLLWQASNMPALEIGSLIALLNDEDQNHWSIGEIMWLHQKDNDNIETGVKIISQNPIPVAVDVPLKACMHVNFLPALLLPPNKSRQQPAKLLVGKHGFEKGDQVNITQGDDDNSIQLTRLLRQYQHNNLFECGFYNPRVSTHITKH